MPEAEQELIGGYHTEYSGMKLLLFLIAEFLHMITASFLIVILFLGGWHFWGLTGSGDTVTWPTAILRIVVLSAKILLVIVFFMLVRWSWPRFRFDQLMTLAWKVMLPLGLVNLVVAAVLVEYRDAIAQAVGTNSLWVPIAISWGVMLAAWIVAGLLAPLATDNTPRPAALPFDAEQELKHMKPDDPNITWIEEPKLGLAGRMYLPLLSAGLTTTVKHLAQPEGHGQLSGGAAEDRQSADLSRRASAEQGRRRPREVRGLFSVRHGLPGALHRHCGRAQPLARSGEVSGELFDRRAALHLLRHVRGSLPGRCHRADEPATT